MQPTLNPNKNSEDYVFLSRWALKDLYFERGDIISMVSPKDQNYRIIKRIVGLQGLCCVDMNLKLKLKLIEF